MTLLFPKYETIAEMQWQTVIFPSTHCVLSYQCYWLLRVLSLNWIHSKIISGATFRIIGLTKIPKIWISSTRLDLPFYSNNHGMQCQCHMVANCGLNLSCWPVHKRRKRVHYNLGLFVEQEVHLVTCNVTDKIILFVISWLTLLLALMWPNVWPKQPETVNVHCPKVSSTNV